MFGNFGVGRVTRHQENGDGKKNLANSTAGSPRLWWRWKKKRAAWPPLYLGPIIGDLRFSGGV